MSDTLTREQTPCCWRCGLPMGRRPFCPASPQSLPCMSGASQASNANRAIRKMQNKDERIKALGIRADELGRARDELVNALDRASRQLWEALGGGDDEQCREIADSRCKQFEELVAKHRKVKP